MLRLVLTVALLALAGCNSGTSVHIFTLGVEEAEITQLAALLEAEDFDVLPNELPVPVSITRHTIVFPAIVQDFQTVRSVELAMEAAGYANPRLVLEAESNHYYSAENIGIYLVNPDDRFGPRHAEYDPFALGGADASSLTKNYFSECPEGSEAQSELNLFPAGVAILEEFVWDEDASSEVSVVHDGEWRADANTVEVELFDSGNLVFAVTEHSGINFFGSYHGVTLKVDSSNTSIAVCDYTHLSYEQ